MLLRELRGTGAEIAERGTTAAAKALGKVLPVLVFVPPDESGGLAHLGQATSVIRSSVVAFEDANGHVPEKEIAYFSQLGEKISDDISDGSLCSFPKNAILLMISEFGADESGRKRFAELSPGCNTAYIASELAPALRRLRLSLATAFDTRPEVVALWDEAIGGLHQSCDCPI